MEIIGECIFSGETVSWPQASHSSVVAGATLLPDEVTRVRLGPQQGPQLDQSGAFPDIQGSRPGMRPGLQHGARDPVLGPGGWSACPWEDRINSGKLLVKDRKKITETSCSTKLFFLPPLIKLVGRVKNDLCDLCKWIPPSL